MAADTPVSLHFVLPLPPGINNSYVTVGKRRVLSTVAKNFKKDVKKLVDEARLQGAIPPQVEAQVQRSLLGVYLTFYFETPNRRDLDGGLKIALDALITSLGADDRAVVDLHLTKQIDPLHPRLEVDLETIHDWTFDQSFVYLGEREANADE